MYYYDTILMVIIMESKKLLVNNIPDGKIIQIIRAKPINHLFFVIAIAMTLIVSNIDEVVQLMGIMLFVLAVFGLAFLPERKLISFYKNYLIVYNEVNRSFCNLLYYDEILSYHYSKGRKYDILSIETVDNSIYEVPCFDKNMTTTIMKQFAKDKEIVNNSRLLG